MHYTMPHGQGGSPTATKAATRHWQSLSIAACTTLWRMAKEVTQQQPKLQHATGNPYQLQHALRYTA